MTFDTTDVNNVKLVTRFTTDEPALVRTWFKVGEGGSWVPTTPPWRSDNTTAGDTTFTTTLVDSVSTNLSTADLANETIITHAVFK